MTTPWTHADLIAAVNAVAAVIVGAAIVTATFVGPIAAARGADRRRALADKRNDRMRVFRDLMGHRYDVMHPNFVAALNLVQIEFTTSSASMAALAEYRQAFHRDNSKKDGVAEIRKKAIIRLICAVGPEIGYKLKQIELMEQVYAPQGWADVADQQRPIREFIGEIAAGKKAFPVLAIVPEVFVDKIDAKQAAIRTTAIQPTPRRRN